MFPTSAHNTTFWLVSCMKEKVTFSWEKHKRFISLTLNSTRVSPFRGKNCLVIISVGFSLLMFTGYFQILQLKKTIPEGKWLAHYIVSWPLRIRNCDVILYFEKAGFKESSRRGDKRCGANTIKYLGRIYYAIRRMRTYTGQGFSCLLLKTSNFSSGHDLAVREFKPHVRLYADSSEAGACFRFCVSLSASPLLTLSLSLKNKHYYFF